MGFELSVVILSYNNFSETTGPCLESLSRVWDVNLEIIVVDNNSDASTRNGLAEAAKRDARIRLILNEHNRGYAGGNNDGVAAATSELIVLLNSDTRVLENSLPLLAARIRTASTTPLVLGPVTNAAGTEQQIYCHGESVEEILLQGDTWSKNGHSSFFSTDRLTFFCVAMCRKTYLDLGGLDESFGIGFYEDADFCRRALEQGVTLQVMEEAFIYHQGSASFARKPQQVKQLLKENRRRFEKKHGKDREAHVRVKNLQVLKGYLVEAAAEDGFSAPLAYRFANRIRRARQLRPNNYLKRVVYLAQIRRLKQEAIRVGNRQDHELFG